MTTEITKLHSPKLPPLPAYRDHVDRILAKPSRPLYQQVVYRGTRPPVTPSRPPRLYRLALLPVLLALWLWPGWTLGVVCIGGPVALLSWFWWSCRAEAREYNEEHGLGKDR